MALVADFSEADLVTVLGTVGLEGVQVAASEVTPGVASYTASPMIFVADLQAQVLLIFWRLQVQEFVSRLSWERGATVNELGLQLRRVLYVMKRREEIR
jgi:hypothetical protein